jgi:AbrB family looped-hinge helix DNA binding protein
MGETGVGTVTSKGQVTVPKGIRDALQVSEGDRLVFEVEGGRATVRRAPRESLGELFLRQKPWKVRAVPYQRKLRDEWTRRAP